MQKKFIYSGCRQTETHLFIIILVLCCRLTIVIKRKEGEEKEKENDELPTDIRLQYFKSKEMNERARIDREMLQFVRNLLFLEIYMALRKSFSKKKKRKEKINDCQ